MHTDLHKHKFNIKQKQYQQVTLIIAELDLYC